MSNDEMKVAFEGTNWKVGCKGKSLVTVSVCMPEAGNAQIELTTFTESGAGSDSLRTANRVRECLIALELERRIGKTVADFIREMNEHGGRLEDVIGKENT